MSSDFQKRTVRLLAMRGATVGKAGEFLHQTACMNPEIREMIGGLMMYLELFGSPVFKENKLEGYEDDFDQWVYEEVIPSLGYLGWGTWIKTELSELGFLVANTDRMRARVGSDLRELISQLANPKKEE